MDFSKCLQYHLNSDNLLQALKQHVQHHVPTLISQAENINYIINCNDNIYIYDHLQSA